MKQINLTENEYNTIKEIYKYTDLSVDDVLSIVDIDTILNIIKEKIK